MKRALLLLFLMSILPLKAINRIDNEVYKDSDCGLNYTAISAKITDRTKSPEPNGKGLPLTLVVKDIPSTCVEIKQAFVWWTVSYDEGSPEKPNLEITNPYSEKFNFSADMTGFGPAKCWHEDGTRGFRVDVKEAITGNGIYRIDLSNSVKETDGLTLFIVYKDYKADYQGTFVIYDGLATLEKGSFRKIVSGLDVCEDTDDARAFVIVSDLEKAKNKKYPLTINGKTSYLDKNFWNADFVDISLQKGQNYTNIEVNGSDDCFSWITAGVYYQTKNCETCPEPLNLNLTVSKDTVCPGYPVALSAFNADEYEWSSKPYGFLSQQQFPVVNPKVTTTYYVRGNYFNDCVQAFDSVTVFVYESPEVEAGENKEICEGKSVTIGNPATKGTGPYNYDWYPKIGLSADNIAVPSATPPQSITYKVRVTDANGCETEDTVRIVVNYSPEAHGGPDVETCLGDSVKIGEEASGGSGEYSYEWEPADGLSATNIASPMASPNQTTAYNVTVTDSKGCINTDRVIVIVNYPPVANAGEDIELCLGESADIGFPATEGLAPYEYSWFPPDGLESTTEPTVTASPDITTSYIVTVSDANGCISSDTVMVIVNPLPEVRITALGPTRICICDSVTLDAGDGFAYYEWSDGSNGRMLTVTDEGAYSVTVENTKGCRSTSEPVYITNIIPQSTISLPDETIYAKPGDKVDIPVRITSSQNLDSCNADKYHIWVKLNKSILVPTANTPKGSLVFENRIIELTGERTDGDELLNLEFTAALGSVESTAIEIQDFYWDDCLFDSELENGEFELHGLCEEGDVTRLILSGPEDVSLIPNPAEEIVNIGFEAIHESNFTISIYNYLGQVLLQRTIGKQSPGNINTKMNISELTPGSYFVVVRSNFATRTNHLEVR